VPEGFKEALLRAKQKATARQPLGYKIDEMIQAAQDKAEEFYKTTK